MLRQTAAMAELQRGAALLEASRREADPGVAQAECHRALRRAQRREGAAPGKEALFDPLTAIFEDPQLHEVGTRRKAAGVDARIARGITRRGDQATAHDH